MDVLYRISLSNATIFLNHFSPKLKTELPVTAKEESVSLSNLYHVLTYMTITIVATALFATCYKVAINQKCNLQAVNAWVYVGSAGTIILYMLIKGHAEFHPMAVGLGAMTGIATFFATLTFFLHMQKGQLASSWTVISLSLAFPVTASILIWHEHPTPRQVVALILIAVALVLFGRREIRNEASNR
jgi:drug/metabolite transporter (DMT)-like permease